jgi:DNA-binding CsgD family transcriptional regulator
MIGAIARWCDALHAQASIYDALSEMADSIGAEAIILSRLSTSPDQKPSIIAYDKHFTDSSPNKVKQSYVRSVLGNFIGSTKPGSIWVKSTIGLDPDPHLTEFHRRRRMHDLVVVPLCVSRTTSDFLEFHFLDHLSPRQHVLFNLIGSTFVQTWNNRSKGSFTNNVLRLQNQRRPKPSVAPILSMENPARLSRSEYRVCLLLSHGKSVENIETELGISTSTVRSHLRNIYAKTDTSNRAELMYRILTLESLSADTSCGGKVA